MKKNLVIMALIFVLILGFSAWKLVFEPKRSSEENVLGVDITKEDSQKAQSLLQNVESMIVYTERRGNEEVTETTESVSDERIENIPGEFIRKAAFVPEMVLWKGYYQAEIVLKDGERIDSKVSVYGHFFGVEGIEGFFEFKEPEQKEWEMIIEG